METNTRFKKKYLKYKSKYLNIKKLIGGTIYKHEYFISPSLGGSQRPRNFPVSPFPVSDRRTVGNQSHVGSQIAVILSSTAGHSRALWPS